MRRRISAVCYLSGFIIFRKLYMQSVVSGFVKKSFFSCRHMEKDFSCRKHDSTLQYIGFHFVFSMHMDSSVRRFASCCRHYDMLSFAVAGYQKNPLSVIADDFMDTGAWRNFTGTAAVDRASSGSDLFVHCIFSTCFWDIRKNIKNIQTAE